MRKFLASLAWRVFRWAKTSNSKDVHVWGYVTLTKDAISRSNLTELEDVIDGELQGLMSSMRQELLKEAQRVSNGA